MTNNIEINTNYLHSVVKFLTEMDPPRSYDNIFSLNRAAAFIKDEFEAHGLETKIQTFEALGNGYHNVIANYNKSMKKTLIVGGHYDVAGPFPGADDNASAVAGLLELSRLLSENKPNLDYEIEFVAYTLEEPPFFGTKEMGSYVHADSLDNKKVLGMICLEMIGYFSEKEGSQEMPLSLLSHIYPRVGNFIVVAGNLKSAGFTRKLKKHMKRGSDIDVRSLTGPSFTPGISLSDNSNYWKKGYKAVMITDTAFFRNKNYHTENDTIDTLNFPMMGEVVRGVYNAIVNF